MLRIRLYQESLLGVDPDAIGLEPNSFERHLPDSVRELVGPDDFKSFYVEGEGAGTCCPLMLTAMLLLQHRYNVSDKPLIRRCQRDLGWRYAIGLAGGRKPPSLTSFRRFRTKFRTLKGDDFLFNASLKLAQKYGCLDDSALQAIDSTNTNCRGAVIDTYNLVATAIGRVIRTVAQCLSEHPVLLARKWELERYLERSVKGTSPIDWSDEEARNAFLTQEIRDADRLEKLVAELDVVFPPQVGEAIELLQTVALQDVEKLDDGTFQIAKGTKPGRVISITDPEARHGRKSSSKTIKGFKTHVTGTIDSQFVTGIVMTDASVHDAKPTKDLLDQTEANGLKPETCLGDCAYTTGENRDACKQRDVVLLSRLASASRKGAFNKREFDIDLDNMQVTCPAGATASTYTMVKDRNGSDTKVPCFKFAKEACGKCQQQKACGKAVVKNGYRQITLNVHERELQEVKAFNATPEAGPLLRKRSAIERLISHLVRMGMRQARFFGMHMVQFQGFMTAAAYNLQRLMTLVGQRATVVGA